MADLAPDVQQILDGIDSRSAAAAAAPQQTLAPDVQAILDRLDNSPAYLARNPPPPGVSTRYAAPQGGEFGDLNAQAGGRPATAADLKAGPAAAGRIVNAATGAFLNTETSLPPSVQNLIESGGPVGRYITVPTVHLADVAHGVVNAAGAGIAQTAMEALGEKGGRDALALAAVLPMARGELMSPNVAAAPTEAPRPQFVSERMAPVDPTAGTWHRIEQLINHDIAENPPAAPGRGMANQGIFAQPEVPSGAHWPQQPAPVTESPSGAHWGIPGPQSVGAAATPATLTNMPPAEALAARSTGEMQRVLEPARQGVDTTEYVPGVVPTEAEVSGNPSVAFDQKLNRQQNPDPHLARERANNEARVEYYEQNAGTPTQVLRLEQARSDQADADLAAAFGSKGRADAQPVVDTIDSIMADPRLKERGLIQQYIAPLRDKLFDGDALKSDPENLYGIREHIGDMLSRAGKSNDPAIGQVERQLIQIKGALDQSIEGGAPGFRQYLENYAAASQPINAMEYLQAARPKLTNASGTMTPAAFDRFMKDTVAQRAAGGINPALSLTDDQMEVLHNIHSDLKRFGNINLSNPRGSDTSMLLGGVKAAGELGVHAAANMISPVLGSVGVQMGKNAIRQRGVNNMTARVLNPNPTKYPPTGP